MIYTPSYMYFNQLSQLGHKKTVWQWEIWFIYMYSLSRAKVVMEEFRFKYLFCPCNIHIFFVLVSIKFIQIIRVFINLF